jgi:hypothetical protein
MTQPSSRRRVDPAPWGSFPLSELCVLAGLAFTVAGFLQADRPGALLALCGYSIAALAGIELAWREHRAGRASRTTLLAGFACTGAVAATLAAVLLA